MRGCGESKLKGFVDVKSEVSWMIVRGDIDGYLIYSSQSKSIVARRFDNHEIWYEVYTSIVYADHMKHYYDFSSQSLVECCEWLGVSYYNWM